MVTMTFQESVQFPDRIHLLEDYQTSGFQEREWRVSPARPLAILSGILRGPSLFVVSGVVSIGTSTSLSVNFGASAERELVNGARLWSWGLP